ncbi:phage major capsid protein [Halobacillus karajensis]|uniref:Phage major capsid protein, HK97 family n=1 Tax=Halobacillus karajensis TaxID=195088 RepID=A0A059NYL5_9BACI|nr:phage major capsid protein [Halobacillus karajensis]CDQ22577.1 phage major capsid protein, HK97 family [Halobacillus karajensis]CDQ26059.1 phage major capsid protein, HK97 family [Halobacillus karajensis]
MPTFNPDNVLLQDAKNGEIPTEESTLVLKDVMQSSATMQLAQYEEMTKPKKHFTYLADGPGAYWVGEGERIQTSKATWLDAEMEAKKLGVILPVSKEFLNYSVSDFFQQMRPHIAEAFYTKFDQAALFGNDAPYVAGNSVMERATSAGNTIEHGTNATLYQDLAGLLGLVEDGDNDPNGFTTTRKFKQALRNEVDAQNRPIFNDETSGVPSSLLGEAVGYVNKKSWDYDQAKLLTGDWSFARYGILQGIQYSISEDATLTTIQDELGNPINLFERDMFALRATMHVGFMTLKDDAFAALTPVPTTTA